MARIIACDRCGKTINEVSDYVRDFLDKEYVGKDICSSCDAQIVLASEVAKQSAISGQS